MGQFEEVKLTCECCGCCFIPFRSIPLCSVSSVDVWMSFMFSIGRSKGKNVRMHCIADKL